MSNDRNVDVFILLVLLVSNKKKETFLVTLDIDIQRVRHNGVFRPFQNGNMAG